MFNPDLRGVLKNHLSRYSLVTATAKRAREIAVENLQEKNLSTEKPVTVALGEIIDKAREQGYVFRSLEDLAKTKSR